MSAATPGTGAPTLAPDAAELATLRELRAVVSHFIDTWAELITSLPDSYDCHMNCAEANAAADLYRALGDDRTAAIIIGVHAEHDDDEERATHDDDDDPLPASYYADARVQ